MMADDLETFMAEGEEGETSLRAVTLSLDASPRFRALMTEHPSTDDYFRASTHLSSLIRDRTCDPEPSEDRRAAGLVRVLLRWDQSQGGQGHSERLGWVQRSIAPWDFPRTWAMVTFLWNAHVPPVRLRVTR